MQGVDRIRTKPMSDAEFDARFMRMQALLKIQFPNLRSQNKHMIPPPGYFPKASTTGCIAVASQMLTPKRRKTETSSACDNRVSVWNSNKASRSRSSSCSSSDCDISSNNNTSCTSIEGVDQAKSGSESEKCNSAAINSSSSSGGSRKRKSSGRVLQCGTTDHAVSRLEELRPQTHYDLVKSEGPPHAQVFLVSVTVDGQIYTGRGASKQHAKTMAAERALASLLHPHSDPSTAKHSSHSERLTPGRHPVMLLNQHKGGPVNYTLIAEQGESHAKTFTMSVRVGELEFLGEGSNKKDAKYNAAQAAVDALYAS